MCIKDVGEPRSLVLRSYHRNSKIQKNEITFFGYPFFDDLDRHGNGGKGWMEEEVKTYFWIAITRLLRNL